MINRLNHERELLNGEFNEDRTQLTVSVSIVFKLSKFYPFSPPYLYIDSVESVGYLTKWYRIFTPIIRKYNLPLECFCCTTIVCTWSPCNTCKQLYEEYKVYRNKLYLCAKLSYLPKLPVDDNVGSIIATFVI